MTRRTVHLLLATLVALALVAPVGTAAATNGKGNGNANGKSEQAHAKVAAAKAAKEKAKADAKAKTQAATGTFHAVVGRGATTLNLTLPASTVAKWPAHSTGTTVALPIVVGRATVQLTGNGSGTATISSLRHVGGLQRGKGATKVVIHNIVIADGKVTAHVKGPGSASTKVIVATVGPITGTLTKAGKGTTITATGTLTITAAGATALQALGFSASAGTTVPITVTTRVLGRLHR